LFLDLAYLCVLFILSPWLLWRALRTGRYRRHLSAKLLGTSQAPAGTGPIAWFHGVSVGEIHLLSTIIGAFRKRWPHFRIVVSSTTDTGLSEAQIRFPNDAIIPYPFDFSWACSRSLDAIQPNIIVLAESELWPNFLKQAHARKIPVIVANGRMSPRSFARIRKVSGLVQHMLYRHVARFAMQSEEYAERLRQLRVPGHAIVVTGSVKYDGATGERDTPKSRELAQLMGLQADHHLVWLAGSTHAPEEEIVLRVFQRLHARFPQLRLVLVPRHPDRFAEVAALLSQSGLTFARRSQIAEPLQDMPSVVLLDTVGELGAAWGLADMGYTGGSLDGKRGGQSMIEPAGYGVPVLFGPHVWNFRDAAKRLIEAGGAIMIHDEFEMETELARWIENPALRANTGASAQQLVREQQGATVRTLDAIANVMEARTVAGASG